MWLGGRRCDRGQHQRDVRLTPGISPGATTLAAESATAKPEHAHAR
jgi:hypothetical protein